MHAFDSVASLAGHLCPTAFSRTEPRCKTTNHSPKSAGPRRMSMILACFGLETKFFYQGVSQQTLALTETCHAKWLRWSQVRLSMSGFLETGG